MMAFDVIIASDQQIDAMLHSIKRIPTWKLENTQSEREHKRIHQLQLHQQQLEQDKEAETKRKKQRRIIAVPKVQTKKPLSHQGNDLEL
ncbi:MULTISPECIES: histidine kinase [Limosilactobacillus]|uniref:histidine kinase n=1 Tax=Limosilactobacillus TaxID=2742598 RepID=UPI00128E3711|nr:MULTISPECIES: histidine kinase [Limosilactobacillus]MBF0601567.1 histidine kinase [Limosilactobacillus oris]MQB68216.1 histidine kinase [Limosilactobacillus reuteri]